MIVAFVADLVIKWARTSAGLRSASRDGYSPGMKRHAGLFGLLFAFAVVSSGAAHGGTFLQDFVGVWRVKGASVNSTLRVQKQKNGVTSLYMTGTFINKGRLFPNKTYKGETYLKGRMVETYIGTWRLSDANTLRTNVKGRDGLVNAITRRINRDRFVHSETGQPRVTLTRIRN